MLEEKFEQLYLEFRANYYKRMVETIGPRQGSLSATEGYCVEIIHLMGEPTVTEFAHYLGISVPNANYKIGRMVEKGYLTKRPSPTDKREQRLAVTDKFLNYYGLNNQDNAELMRRIRAHFSPGELAALEATIDKILHLMRDNEQGEPE